MLRHNNRFAEITEAAMTFEEALYYKLELSVGLTENFDAYLEKSLVEEEPLSDIILDIVSCGSDYNKIISVLNDFVLDASDSETDNSKYRSLILNDLKELYLSGAKTRKELVEIMNSMAASDDKWLGDGFWGTMYNMWDYYSSMESGYISEEDFNGWFDAFILDGQLSPWRSSRESLCKDEKKPLYKRLSEKFRRIFRR